MDSNVFNSGCEYIFLYNIKSRLSILIYGSWIMGDLEANFLSDGS